LAGILAWTPLLIVAIQWIAALVCTAEVGKTMTWELPGTREYNLTSFAELLGVLAIYSMFLVPPVVLVTAAVISVAVRLRYLPLLRGLLLVLVMAIGVAAWWASRSWSPTFSGFVDWMLD
jgi:hypothetical protein